MVTCLSLFVFDKIHHPHCLVSTVKYWEVLNHNISELIYILLHHVSYFFVKLNRSHFSLSGYVNWYYICIVALVYLNVKTSALVKISTVMITALGYMLLWYVQIDHAYNQDYRNDFNFKFSTACNTKANMPVRWLPKLRPDITFSFWSLLLNYSRI